MFWQASDAHYCKVLRTIWPKRAQQHHNQHASSRGGDSEEEEGGGRETVALVMVRWSVSEEMLLLVLF